MNYVGSLVRTLSAAVSGWLIAKGVEPSAVETFVGSTGQILMGLAIYAATQFWSIKEKKDR